MQKMTASELKSLMARDGDLTVINVLDRDAFEKEHIPGSINIPVSQRDFVEQVQRQVGSKDHEVVVYCASESCDASPKAATKLEDAGFKNVHDFEGGMKEWKEAGEKVNAAAKGARSS